MEVKALIIEDENPAATRLTGLIEEVAPYIEVLGVLDSVASSVAWFKSNDAPDIIFMDIQLSDDLSFSIFSQAEVRSPVIFTTAYDEYALQAFKVNSIDYLLKPIDREELINSIKKWQETRLQAPLTITPDIGNALLTQVTGSSKAFRSRFLVKIGERLHSVKVEDATHFTSENKITFLHTMDKRKYFLDETLEQLSEVLDPGVFFRLNRQVIASIDSIGQIHSYFNGKLKVYLSNVEEPVIVSKEKAPVFKIWLNQ